MRLSTLVSIALCGLTLLATPVFADGTEIRAQIESAGEVIVQKSAKCEIDGRGRSWANVIALSAASTGSSTKVTGYWVYLQDTKVEGGGWSLSSPTDSVGIYTTSMYIDASEAEKLITYLTKTIAKYREIQGKDQPTTAYTFNGKEDVTFEMAVDGKKQEFSIYSNGNLLRGQSFAVAQRRMKVTLKGIEEFEKLLAYLKKSQEWFKAQ